MNRDAYITLATLVALDAVLILLLYAASLHLDQVDRAYIYIALTLHVCMYYGLVTHNHFLIYIAHWGYAFYVITAPFAVRTLVGKCIYTALIAVQFFLLKANGKCVISHVQFKDEPNDHTIFPHGIPFYVYAVVQISLLVIIWAKS